MNIEKDIREILDNRTPENNKVEYKAVLPPAKNIARLISSFANSEGGYIILGVSDSLGLIGLSQDFHANSITHKALDLLSPSPKVEYQYVNYNDISLYVIGIEKSDTVIKLEGKIYKRIGDSSVLKNPQQLDFKANGFERIKTISQQLDDYKTNATNSKIKLIEHYQSILKVMDDLQIILYPKTPDEPTTNQEGKILSRILYSSFADNFETYLSDLLYEIFLADPITLKSKQTVTIEDVLNCSDLQEFIKYWAVQKIAKLQKGSVKGFVKDNKQISSLNVFDNTKIEEVELLLQIRHLYTHRNGIIDEKFLKHYNGDFKLNEEHRMSISEICNKLDYFSWLVNELDNSAIEKYNLAIYE
ncbi:AlbA family DNA-binding domain-containing protein [Aestuariibaculum sediminum]|uniref:ATP-binding protein n=1 Tax=Aestuariibaculum sediminum TaxID=2770637 RepID=A0A8J6PZS2_9FLAO|nr:ATP-binding protein [Aestuariibaculum sediminum]MBD0832523.1 ATP-binding protein [Aestuariibaculum sediminum]